MSLHQPSKRAFAVILGISVGATVALSFVAVLGVDPTAPSTLARAGLAGLTATVFGLSVPWLPGQLVQKRLHRVPALVTLVLTLVRVSSVAAPFEWLRATDLSVLVGLLIATGLLWLVTGNRYAAMLFEAEEPIVEWTASPDARYARRIKVASFLGAIALFVLTSVVHHSLVEILSAFATTLVVQSLFYGRSTRYRLFEAEIVAKTPRTIGYQVVPVERLRSVDTTAEALTIRQFPWPFPIRSSLASIRDPEQVEAALRERIES